MKGYKFKAVLVGRYNWNRAKAFRLGFFDSPDEAWAAFAAPMSDACKSFVEAEKRVRCKVDVYKINLDGVSGRRVETLESPDQRFDPR